MAINPFLSPLGVLKTGGDPNEYIAAGIHSAEDYSEGHLTALSQQGNHDVFRGVPIVDPLMKSIDKWGPLALGAIAGGGAAGLLGEGAAGAAGAGGTIGTETALAGGAAAAGGEEAAALGSGLKAGAAGATGLTAGTTAGGIGEGAVGTGITGGATGALAPGYFAGETAYPVAGGLAGAVGATGAPGSAVGGSAAGGAAATGAASGTALSRLLDGTGSTADYLSVLGPLGAAGLGVYGATQQANAYSDLANKYLAIGSPSRERYEGSFAPEFSMGNEPGYKDALDQTTKSTLHSLSVNGNPADSPNAWAQTLSDVNSKFAYPALQTYRNQNAATGGYGAFSTAAPAASSNAITAQGGALNAVGAGINDIFNPKPSLYDLVRSLRA